MDYGGAGGIIVVSVLIVLSKSSGRKTKEASGCPPNRGKFMKGR